MLISFHYESEGKEKVCLIHGDYALILHIQQGLELSGMRRDPMETDLTTDIWVISSTYFSMKIHRGKKKIMPPQRTYNAEKYFKKLHIKL